MKSTIQIDGLPTEVLRVPYFSQDPVEWLCVVYSIKMVFDFYRNIHENEYVRSISPLTDKDQIVKVTNTRPNTGTLISEDLMIKLRAEFPNMEFELKETNYSEVEDELNKNHPVIVLYNPSYLLINEKGPGHAGVVVGMTNTYIILNNPWMGPSFCIDKTKFDSLWELEYNWAIFIKPKLDRTLT